MAKRWNEELFGKAPEEMLEEWIATAKRSGEFRMDLARMGLTTLPASLGQLSRLRWLDLSGNQLRELPASFGQLSELQSLDLSGNQLRELPASFGKLSRLEDLWLSDNKLHELPASFGQLSQLRSLWLNSNQLRELPASFGQLSGLRALWLDSNQLGALPASLRHLAELEVLDLSDNQLRELPGSLRDLPKLKELWLNENPELSLPPEAVVIYDRPKEILDYYFSERKRAAASGTQPLNEAKVLVLGEAEVGKSSLIVAMTEGRLDQRLDKTHGIVQKPWGLPLRGGRLATEGAEGEETLRLNLWDFGGQEVYHSTHTFFLTRRAVYLLVCDARANDRQNNLEYWLQMAASFGAGAPVWVAVNKADQHGAGPDEHALRRKFPNIRGFLRTSCKTGKGIAQLRETLAAEALALEGVRQDMNNLWLGIKRALEELKQDTLTLEDYVRLCREHKETEEGRPEKLLDLWDKLGTVRYFPTRPEDPPAMRDTAILNPEWVTKAVYAVLDDAAVRAAGGLATEGDFARILKRIGHDAGRHAMIEHVMRRFDLLYDTTEFQPSRKMLVPQLLPEREPEHAWPDCGTLCFVYRYPVLPAGLVPGFIARRHRLLSRTPGPWRHGCVLDFPTGARARVIGDAEQKQVTISVTGDAIAARDALDAVRGTFEEMHGAIEGLEVGELIPVPGRPDAPLVGYRHLRALDVNGVPKHFAQGATPSEIIEVDVREALSAVRGPKKAEAEAQTVNIFEKGSNPTLAMRDANQQNIKVGRDLTGNVGINQTFTHCYTTAAAVEQPALAQALKGLIVEAEKAAPQLPEPERAKLEKKLKRLTDDAKEPTPDQEELQLSAKGIIEAASIFPAVITATKAVLGFFGIPIP